MRVDVQQSVGLIWCCGQVNDLGGLLKARGNLEGAEALYREALTARRETLGSRHPDTLISVGWLSGVWGWFGLQGCIVSVGLVCYWL